MGNFSKMSQIAIIGLLGCIALSTIFNLMNASGVENFLFIAIVILIIVGFLGVLIYPE
jgi:hypothetical protein